MPTLFNNDNGQGGFRLRYLEVFNWGTFHGRVFRLKTNCSTSLLTGANGSGKTTLIDALLTLLVPSQKRFYNQSSGLEAKRERDEYSYFWGYHGKSYSELEEKAKTEQLRTKSDNPYSVLLACFQNAGTLHTITLVQVRWYSNSGLQKVFLVAPYQLEIDKHFGKGRFDHRGEWKKKLQREFPKTDFFNSFKEYSARFSELFGLKEKALSLFNQTVGIKVLGDLTPFIRQHMLEEPEAEEQFTSLLDHYTNLLVSHRAIRKDEMQLEMLRPIMRNRERIVELQINRGELDLIEEQMRFFLGKIEYDLIEKHLQRLEQDIAEREAAKQQAEVALNTLDRQKEELIIQKAKYNIESQVQLLKKDVEAETEKRQMKYTACSAYQQGLRDLTLPNNISESIFKENAQKIKDLNAASQKEEEQFTEKKFRLKIEAESLEKKISQLQLEITSLQKRRNRIPEDLIAARKRLANILDTSEGELPFAGELMKVLPQESHWEDAVERLLHSFSMQLLIPAKFSKQANQFIHANDMRTKLVYHKIDPRPTATLVRWSNDDDVVINKLEIKDTPYKEWLERYLLERFDYYCTDDLEVFWGSSKAITSNGLIRNANRHEKDDRPGRWDKGKYRLGWDNRATIHYLLQQKQHMENEHSGGMASLRQLEPLMTKVKTKLQILGQLFQYKTFEELNWQQHAEKVALYNRRIEELEKSSDAYLTIVAQLGEVEKEIGTRKKQHEKIAKELGSLEKESLDKNKRKLTIEFDGLTQEGHAAIEAFFTNEAFSADNIHEFTALDEFYKAVLFRFKTRKDAVTKALSQTEQETTSLIAVFVNPGEKITKEFADWSGDVLNISPTLQSLDELASLHDLIINQRLVEHKRRFKDYMDRSMLDALTNYRTWLSSEVEKIRDIVEELNVPLKKITFNKNPDTYLQLECKSTKEQDIRIFNEKLNLAVPNIIEFAKNDDENYREQVFEKIKSLITELQKEEAWRKKVTDVRNWLTFSAREYAVVDDKATRYHDSTASYSGGQKAQFTYAILGAAIAHQFGIYEEGRQHRSLRFITVDEAFSKLDPQKSEFLMEFCAQLNLQLLIVTPLDKINIAERYINAVHYVEIKNQKNSVLHNLTMDEYEEKKEAFKQLAETNG